MRGAQGSVKHQSSAPLARHRRQREALGVIQTQQHEGFGRVEFSRGAVERGVGFFGVELEAEGVVVGFVALLKIWGAGAGDMGRVGFKSVSNFHEPPSLGEQI